MTCNSSGFRHKGLRQLHEDGNAKGVPSAMADKLHKLLFALETAASLEQLDRFPGWKLHPLKGGLNNASGALVNFQPDRHRKLAADFRIPGEDEHGQRN